MVVYDRAMDWLIHHEDLAAWIGAIATVLTLISRFTRSSGVGNTVSVIVLFITFAPEATIACRLRQASERGYWRVLRRVFRFRGPLSHGLKATGSRINNTIGRRITAPLLPGR